jgi:hypothetical protein
MEGGKEERSLSEEVKCLGSAGMSRESVMLEALMF